MSKEKTPAGINRRSVLKKTGATFAAGAVATGTASACGKEYTGDPQIVFCGCSQVCWCIDTCGKNSVEIVADGEVVKSTTDETGCYSGDKIQKVRFGGTTYCNPNQNCSKVNCSPNGAQSGGPCGKPPCRHPSNKGGRGQP